MSSRLRSLKGRAQVARPFAYSHRRPLQRQNCPLRKTPRCVGLASSLLLRERHKQYGCPRQLSQIDRLPKNAKGLSLQSLDVLQTSVAPWYTACYRACPTEASFITSGCAKGHDDDVVPKPRICMLQEEED